MNLDARGGCLCGQLRWSVAGEVLFSGFCHCRDCQRSSGAGGRPFVGVGSEDVELRGASHAFTSTGTSGRTIERHFCPSCGSTVFARPPRPADFTIIYAGSFDEPQLFAPSIAIFTRSRPGWEGRRPGLQEFRDDA